MEWPADDAADAAAEEEQGLKGAFTLVREPPSPVRPTKANKGRAAEVPQATIALQLAAFPALFAGEPEEQSLARCAAAHRCWDALATNIEETLERTDAHVFEDLLDFARCSHRTAHITAAAAAEAPDAGCQRLPTGLVVAGGVNSADHCRTFPCLAAFLRQHGCYMALLQPHSMGKHPQTAVNEVLRQLSGLGDSRAEHMEAIQQWYADETGVLLLLPDEPEEEEEGEGGSDDEAAAADDGRRRLRRRPDPAAPAVPTTATPAQLEARQRPLVVIVEGTEGVDTLCLRDFILAASEAYHAVPLTLMLGLTTDALALHTLLASEITDRCMDLHHFKLATGMARLDALVEHVLLGASGQWPGLLFSQAIVATLNDSFLAHHYSAGCITQGLRVAALEHFREQPTSFLAAAAMDGEEAVTAALEQLDARTLAQVKKALGCSRGGPELAQIVEDAQAGWSRWAVGVQLLALAAEAAGPFQSMRPWKLLEEALHSRFVDEQLGELLEPVERRLRDLPTETVQQLAAAMQQRIEAVWGGAEAAAEQLAELAPFASGEAAAEQQQQQQQQQRRQEGAVQQAAAVVVVQDEEQQAAQGKGKAKRDKFHSKQSRNQALLQKAAAQAAAKGIKPTAELEAEVQAATPGARLAAWLAPALRALLATPPTKLPGAAVFTCRSTSALDCLTAEPRAALALALTEPHHFLPGVPEALGLSAEQEDACLAYRLFDQDPNCVNLADWYESFESVHTGAAAGGPGSAAKPKRAAVKKGKKKAGSSAAPGSATGAGEGGEGSVDAARRRRQELAARFSQATAELQYVGLIKPAKRRRGDFVQRVVHFPAAGLED